ncbi:helix-turn-helix domain-containing protein [Edaphobacter aggregans]|uniref:helix-turn-helix domain-containing protein n=1 Tax=Edaphobacter aggregans TaxID=570835 RepID=UPI003CCB7CAF
MNLTSRREHTVCGAECLKEKRIYKRGETEFEWRYLSVDHILRALEASNWIVGGRNGAAERLGMKRTSLVYRIRKLRISRPASSSRNGAVESHALQD